MSLIGTSAHELAAAPRSAEKLRAVRAYAGTAPGQSPDRILPDTEPVAHRRRVELDPAAKLLVVGHLSIEPIDRSGREHDHARKRGSQPRRSLPQEYADCDHERRHAAARVGQHQGGQRQQHGEPLPGAKAGKETQCSSFGNDVGIEKKSGSQLSELMDDIPPQNLSDDKDRVDPQSQSHTEIDTLEAGQSESDRNAAGEKKELPERIEAIR